MRIVHVFAVSAALALGASVATANLASAQGLLQASPMPDGSGQVGKPKDDDTKFQTGTALPPKTGALVYLNRTRQKELLTLTRDGQWTARRIRAK